MADKDLNQKRTEDNYAACSAYEDRIGDSKHEKHDDVIVFEHRNGLHYFATLDENNAIALRSEGYPTTGARDNGLKSVIRNREKRERFKIDEDRENYYTCLTAGNNQEIGRSCPKKSRQAAELLIPPMSAAALALAERVAADAKLAEERTAAAAAKEAEALSLAASSAKTEGYVPNAEREQDNYLVCSEYQERVGDSKHEKHDDVIVFQHANELYYFATVDNNNDVALRSEGYPTTGARDNGLKSVLRNREKRARFKLEKNRGLFFTCLTAGNNQEIGRSCPKKSESAAMAIWAPMSAAALALKAREAEAAAAIEAPAVAATPAPAPKKKKVSSSSRVTENYLKCEEYEARIQDSKHPDHNDVIAFSHKNGLHYFATLDSNGEIALRSEGYQSTGARENGIQSVFKNRKIEKHYVVIRKGNTYYTALKAGNHQEIGRSCKKKSKEAANWLIPGAAAAGLGLAAASVSVPTPAPPTPAPAPVPAPAPKIEVPAPPPPPAPVVPEPPKEKEDDYLVCKEYAGRKVNDKKNNVSLFKHGNGQFYFAIVDNEGGVRLRSEGFSSSQERDQELSGALRFLEDESKYSRITKGKYHINVLHDETGREVGRSCAAKEAIPFLPLVAVAAAAIPVVAAVPKPTPPPKKKAPVAAVAAAGAVAGAAATSAAAVPPVAAAAAKGGCAPWMWILGLIALLGLLFYLLPQGCNGLGCNAPNTAAVVAPAVEAPIVEKPVVAEPPPAAPEPVAAPVPEPVVASCNCNSLTHPVFDIPNTKPNNITRLGRAPEFGNSHSLSPAEFFAKLQRRAANNTADRTFLNGIAKAMGYSNFSELSADEFSSVTLERGTTGNLGSTPRHKTIYATLNTSGQDLKAFRIKAANGCDLHFMKTCGNHMFFCPKK
ncbi:MAG: YegP family protein [Saprospiraceae bacterium]